MATTKWVLDPVHSQLGFKVRHLMITNVSGHFTKFEGQADAEDEDFSKARASVTIQAASIDTNNADRDGHLQSGDFFDAAKFPTIRFETTKIENLDNEGAYHVSGNLTIRDTTKLVRLKVEFGGVTTDHMGNIKAGFTVEGKINRKDFGLKWEALTEAGGIVLADEVRIDSELQFRKA